MELQKIRRSKSRPWIGTGCFAANWSTKTVKSPNAPAWLVNSQAFMFTAYAVTTIGLGNPQLAQGGISIFPGQALLLFRLLPLVAIFTVLLIYIGILAAVKAIRELRRAYQAKATIPDGLVFQTSMSTRLLGLAAPMLLPLLFMAVWSVLLIRSFR